MNFKFDGVLSIFYSQRSQLVYCGGEDGSIIALQLQNPTFIKPVMYIVPKHEHDSCVANHKIIKDY